MADVCNHKKYAYNSAFFKLISHLCKKKMKKYVSLTLLNVLPSSIFITFLIHIFILIIKGNKMLIYGVYLRNAFSGILVAYCLVKRYYIYCFGKHY